MSFSLLFSDELRGFYRSKVMMFLWVGLPLMSLLLQLWQPDPGEDMSFAVLSAILVSSIGGTLAAVMLAVSIINEKNSRAYDLFLIRPIQRWSLVASKFTAVYLCIAIAAGLALLTGMVFDYAVMGGTPDAVLEAVGESLAISLSMMAVASAAGVLIGVVSPSVLLGAILVIYGGNQVSALPMLPSLTGMEHPVAFTIALGAAATAVLLGLAIALFNRKQF